MINFLNYNFAGKKVLMRVDFNVPLNKTTFEVTDDTRIRGAAPSIQKILKDGGSVVLVSHLDRPKSNTDAACSMQHLIPTIEKILNVHIKFENDSIGEKVKNAVANLNKGEVLLLQNIRYYAQEEAGDIEFAKQLAQIGCNVYVNDAFGTAHRAHASTCTVAQFFSDKMFGLLMNSEIENASKILQGAKTPVLAILGGAKVSDKIMLIESLLNKVNHIIIGGGMAYTFIQALGGSVGKSLVEADKIETAKQIILLAKQKGVSLYFPADSLCANQFSNEADTKMENSNNIDADYMGLDIGNKAIEDFGKIIEQAKTIFWNGPMGVFEMPKFKNGTQAIAMQLVKATKNGTYTLIGGGDSVAAIQQLGLANQVSYISTGGGAMLEFLEGKTLPGIDAILN